MRNNRPLASTTRPLLRLLLVAAVAIPIVACFGGSSEVDDAGDDASDDASTLEGVDVTCHDDEVTLQATAYGSFDAVEVQVWEDTEVIETVDLTYRGDDDWYGVTTTERTIDACLGGDTRFLFRGLSENGEVLFETDV